MKRRGLWTALVVLAGVLVSSSGQAAPPAPSEPDAQATPATDEASRRFRRGVEFHKEGDLRSALVEFEQAYAIAPNYRVLFNIGQLKAQMLDYSGAVSAYRQYLTEGKDAIGSARRAEVDGELARLAPRVATLEVSVDQEGAEVVAEGDRRVPLGTSPLRGAILLNPGSWSISAQKDGFRRASEAVIIAGGDHRSVALVLVPEVVAPTPAPVVVAPAERPRPPAVPRHRAVPWAGLAVTGALAIGTVAAGVLTLSAKSDYETARDRFGASPTEISDARTKTRTWITVTDLVGAATLLAGGITLVRYLLADSRAKAGPVASIQAVVGPTASLLVFSIDANHAAR